ncbi:MAG: glutamine synthetase [Candidatus Stahlbacteria bacterium]|nr:glutamine synthetase [Candidatus Stahlbacteria bacterium]
MTKEGVLELAKEKEIRFIQLWFTDVIGNLKSVSIPMSQLADALENGKGFDGSSIEGFTRIHESDMIAMPDINTFAVLPWSPKEARMFCDILLPDKTPYEGDPRYVLKRNLAEARKLGFTYYLGPELEYFYFKDSSLTLTTLDKGGYFDLTPPDVGDELRMKTVAILEEMGIPVEASHHEVAPSQHEIDLVYDEALAMADFTMTYKLVTKEIAQQNGVYATFMPKPIFGINGSGMHVHQSLFKGDKNVFFGTSGKLSKIGEEFMAGLLTHAKEITLVTNQWVNSYKRLVPGYEAPVYISWANRNRSTLVRVPMYFPDKPNAVRIEYRSPDPACNPYLAYTVLLQAGLEGMRKHYKLPAPIEEDVYALSSEERKAKGITYLPESLGEAIAHTKKSELVLKALGADVFFKLLENKKRIWEDYRSQVTQYEIEKDLPVL